MTVVKGRPPTLRKELWEALIAVTDGPITSKDLALSLGKNAVMIRDAMEWLVNNNVIVKVWPAPTRCAYLCIGALAEPLTSVEKRRIADNIFTAEEYADRQIKVAKLNKQKLTKPKKKIIRKKK